MPFFKRSRAVKFCHILLLSLTWIFLSCTTSVKKEFTEEKTPVRLSPDVTPEMLNASFWIKRCVSPDRVLMSRKKIQKTNAKAKKLQSAYYTTNLTLMLDLREMPPLTKAQVRSFMFNGYEKWKLYQIEDGESVLRTPSFWEKLIDYAGIKVLEENEELCEAREMVCVKRADMRCYPSEEFFSAESDYWYDDFAQNSALLLNEPVLSYYVSPDEKWNFVVSSSCMGWVKSEYLAYCSHEEFTSLFDYDSRPLSDFFTVTEHYFSLPQEYVIYNDGGVEVEPFPVELSMGVHLLCASWNDLDMNAWEERFPYDCFAVYVPYRRADGSLGRVKASVPASLGVMGLLPYTSANVIDLLFGALGNRYGWGGMAGQRDCSALAQETFRCFGIELPRNSSAQGKYPARKIFFRKSHTLRRQNLLDKAPPGAIVRLPGHIAFYLGEYKGKQYLLSATEGYYNTKKDRASGDWVRLNSVNINSVDVIRKSGKTWLGDIVEITY